MPTMDSHRSSVLLVDRAGISETVMRVLVLGGTGEASELARRLANDKRFTLTLSLAGRTAAPLPQPISQRVGGFGGADGLADWLAAERIEAIVDATHPFAARISANAVTAARRAALPLLTLLRPPWQRQAGDAWTCVDSAKAAAAALGREPRRVFLTIGRQEVAAFRAAPQHAYLIRSIDPPEENDLPPDAELILQRGPFEDRAEIALMRDRAIDVLVAKNSGAGATYAKIAAARELRLPVIMIDQPPKPADMIVTDVAAACAWLSSLADDHAGPPSDRGV
jgi:precorrin-6A/cobalt-precorrin-6A reductase